MKDGRRGVSTRLPHRRESAGFTLVELLVVTALIGILAALAVPTYGAVRRVAYNSMALADLTSVRTAVLGDIASLPESGTISMTGPAAFPIAPNVRISREVTVRLEISSGSDGYNGKGHGKGGNGNGNNGNGKGNQGGDETTSSDASYTITSTHSRGSATYQTDATGRITATGATL